VYSSDATIRTRVQQILGRLPDKNGAPMDFVGVATAPVVHREISAGAIDLAILDGEARPVGGIGLAKQLKDELLQCPPIVLLTARPEDAWLADWSGAEAVIQRALNPLGTAAVLVPLLRARLIA